MKSKMPPKGMHKMPSGMMMPGKKHMPEKEMKGMMGKGKPQKKNK